MEETDISSLNSYPDADKISKPLGGRVYENDGDRCDTVEKERFLGDHGPTLSPIAQIVF